MTIVQRVARISGWGFVVLAIWGGLVAGTSMVADPAFAPRLWGVFPINFPHNLVHLAFGLWGLNAAGSVGRAKTYASVGGSVYLLLAGLGLFAPSMFGLMPIGGNDVWLHAIIAVVLLGAAVTTPAPPVGPAEPEPDVEPRGGGTGTASPEHGRTERPPQVPKGDAPGHAP